MKTSSTIRMILLLACVVAASAVNVSSQPLPLDTARIPVRVNMAANVSIQPDNGVAGEGASKNNVQAYRTDTLMILIASTVSITHGKRTHGAPAMIRRNRNGVLLTLAPQFDNADIALFSVNGKRILRGKASAGTGGISLSRANVTAGVYLLSIKGAKGNSFSAKLNHKGGNMNVSVSFGGAGSALHKGADVGTWTITATATSGNARASRTFTPREGMNDLMELTLTTQPDGGNDSTVTIQYSSSGAPTINNPMADKGVAITTNGQHVTVNATTTTQVNYVLSGSTDNGSFKQYGDLRFKLTLDGVNITNQSGPAVNIQNGKRVDVMLPAGKTSKLTDGMSYNTPVNVNGKSEDQKAAFFSEAQLVFDGTGTLEVTGRNKHGICSDDWIRIVSGNIKINAKTDGIHTNDSLVMSGGALDVTAESDGIDVEKGDAHISGGTIKMAISGEGSKGIKSDGNMTITGGDFDITVSANAYYSSADDDNKSPAGMKCDGDM